MAARYTCPCCGFQTFDEAPGSHQVCHVCSWEDDAVQLLDPWFAGGANRPSLRDAQDAYLVCGAMEQRFLPNVKGALSTDTRDPTWRCVREYDRTFSRAPSDLSADEQRDAMTWYYWRRSAA